MTLEYEDIEELRKALANVEFGKVEMQIHESIIISITVTTVKKKPVPKKDRIVVHTPSKPLKLV